MQHFVKRKGFMRRINLSGIFGLLVIPSLIISCSIRGEQNTSGSLRTVSRATPSLKETPSPDPVPSSKSSIRSVDFNRLAYPKFPDYSGDEKKLITLKPGEGGPSHINYGDVTGDGEEEAMVVLPIENRGSALPYYVYIFTMERGNPKLLWDFETGDRADGGLRQIYAERGELVIELYGKDRVIGSELYKGDEGLCCPSSFTRSLYKWNANGFQLAGQESLPNSRGDASPTMPVYHPPN
jgi:hypothetical protein